MWESPKALLLSWIQKQTGKNIIIITSGKREDRLYGDLSYFFSEENILEFPSWETLPGEKIKPSRDIIGKRMQILYTLMEKKGPFLVLASMQALLQKVVPKENLKPLFPRWTKKSSFPFSQIETYFTSLGYKRVSLVSDKGEFSLRGGIVDVFIPSYPLPFRLDFFADSIEEIRVFDPGSQKTLHKENELILCPADETILLQKQKNSSHLFDYFNDQTLLVFDDLVAIEDSYVALKQMPGFNSSEFLSLDDFLYIAKMYPQCFFSSHPIEELSAETVAEKRREKALQNVTFDYFSFV